MATWKVSSYCNNGTCVAVSVLADGRIGVRDTKHDNGPVLSISREDWSALLQNLKR